MALTYLIFLPVAIAAVIVIVVAVTASRNRGKLLKCPECGQVFKAPAMDEKLSGLGWTIPYTGNVKCPHCGGKRSRRDYSKVEQQTATTT